MSAPEALTQEILLHGHGRSWECAIALLEHDLTLQQRILCEIAAIAGPDEADLEVIALAAQILGERA